MKKNALTLLSLMILNIPAAAKAEDCNLVYTQLLKGYVTTMNSGRALGEKIDLSAPVEIVSTNDRQPGSYDLTRDVVLKAARKLGGRPLAITLVSSGDEFCTDERIVKVSSAE